MEIENHDYEQFRLSRHKDISKYAATFERLRPGQCIKIERKGSNKAAMRVADSLRKWVCYKALSADLQVRCISDCGDGFGRVWLLQKKKAPIKMADLPRRVIKNLE